MLLLPQKGDTKIISNSGIVGAANPGTAVPGHASTANSYGTLTEIISAANNTQDSWGMMIYIANTGASATVSQASLDIYVGGATDDLLIKSLLCGYRAPSSGGVATYFFPIHTPPGKRIAAQLSSARTGIAADVMIWLFGGGVPPFRPGSRVTTYGTKADNSRGLAVTPTASGGTASVTEMSSSSTYDHFYLMPGFQAANDTTLTPSGAINLGIGVGASTEERIGTWWYYKGTSEDTGGPWPAIGVFRSVPASTRLTMLASNSGANDAGYDGHVYAVS